MNSENKMKQLLFSIGLARRAGKLIVGTEMVCDGIRHEKVRIVVSAVDNSDNTKKRISDCCAYYKIPLYVIEADKEMLGHAIGKTHAACIGVTDENLSELISRNLKEIKEKGE